MQEQELYEVYEINVIVLCEVRWFKVGVQKPWVPGHRGSRIFVQWQLMFVGPSYGTYLVLTILVP